LSGRRLTRPCFANNSTGDGLWPRMAVVPEPGTSSCVVIPIVAGIGNALLAEPMVRRLLEANQKVRIVVLARNAAMGEVFARLNLIAPGRVTVHIVGSGLAGQWRMVRLARASGADVYLVPFPSNRWQYNLLVATSGARRRVLHSYPFGKIRTLAFLPATRVPAVRGLHDVEQNLRLLEATGLVGPIAGPISGPAFVVTDTERAMAAKLLSTVNMGADSRFIVIHAGGARTVVGAAKRWPPTLFAQLISQLHGRVNHRLLLIEGPDEAGVTDEIRSHLPLLPGPQAVSALRLTGTLGDAAALLEKSTLYVGSDSGLAHLAAAVGRRAVTIFAPADPDRVCPWGNRDLVVQVKKSCAPCLRYPWSATRPKVRCGPNTCVAEVGVDQVLAAVIRGLSEIKASTVPVRVAAGEARQ
jgi:ADP-heptose:LPS heptosyltransferase